MYSIRKFRKEKGITQKELAKATGIDDTLISRYETGVAIPPLSRLSAIAKALDVSLDELCDIQLPPSLQSIQSRELRFALIQMSNGRCDLCMNDAPFFTEDARPYLELHHIIPISEGGKITLSNSVVLCPNCHKKVQILKNDHDILKLQAIANARDKEHRFL